jgi:hypothetical protein
MAFLVLAAAIDLVGDRINLLRYVTAALSDTLASGVSVEAEREAKAKAARFLDILKPGKPAKARAEPEADPPLVMTKEGFLERRSAF